MNPAQMSADEAKDEVVSEDNPSPESVPTEEVGESGKLYCPIRGAF